MFFDQNEINEINQSHRYIWKVANIWKLNKDVNNTWVKEELTMDIRKYFVMNRQIQYKMHFIFVNTAKMCLKEHV